MLCVLILAAIIASEPRLFFASALIAAITVFGFLGVFLIDNHRYAVATLVFLSPVFVLALMTVSSGRARNIAWWLNEDLPSRQTRLG